MAKKGNQRHIKSLAAPKYFGIERKQHKYVAKPTAGRHTLDKSIAANLLIKILKLAETTSETNKIIKNGKMSVNDKIIKNTHYPIGFNDVVKFEGAKSYIISIDRRAKVKPIEYKESSLRVLKVVGKYKIKEGKVMLRLHSNVIIEGDNSIKVNDSVTTSNNKITKIIKMQEGGKCFIINGVHVGKSGKIISIKKGTRKSDTTIGVETEQKDKFETITNNIIVVG